MDKAAIAALANIIQVINRIGTTADGSGVASLFGKLAAILADTSLIKGYTDQVEGYVDTLESSLVTVLADLITIKGYTDTLETKVGTNADGAGTSTLFARLAQIAGYTDNVETNLGSNADASSPTGSTHAKLKDVKDAVSALKALPAGAAQWGGTTTTDQSNTLLNISGAGWLYAVNIPGNNDSPGNASIRVDGGTIRGISGFGERFVPVRFTSSLVVKSSGTGGASSWAVAVLD